MLGKGAGVNPSDHSYNRPKKIEYAKLGEK